MSSIASNGLFIVIEPSFIAENVKGNGYWLVNILFHKSIAFANKMFALRVFNRILPVMYPVKYEMLPLKTSLIFLNI